MEHEGRESEARQLQRQAPSPTHDPVNRQTILSTPLTWRRAGNPNAFVMNASPKRSPAAPGRSERRPPLKRSCRERVREGNDAMTGLGAGPGRIRSPLVRANGPAARGRRSTPCQKT
jgi:hypothetical protein